MAQKTEKITELTGKSAGTRGGLVEGSWEPLTNLREEIDNLFDEFAPGWTHNPLRQSRHSVAETSRGTVAGWATGVLAIDVVDKQKEVLVRAELPGMDETDIDVRFSDDKLTICGEKTGAHEDGEEVGSYYVSERRYGTFGRIIPVPQGIDADKVEASFSKGVLTVTLPKTRQAQDRSKKIDVKSTN